MLINKTVNGLFLLFNKNIYTNQRRFKKTPKGSEALDAQTPPKAKYSLNQVC